MMKVSILCLAYNHEKYIRKCLDGFVMQKCDFDYEVLIHDDASTDGTADIIREYEARYPNIIKPIYQTENQYSKGIKISKMYQRPRISGEYVAWCEGDDYWIDENKLQRQVDFLDKNLDYSVCAHKVRVNELKYNTQTVIPIVNSDRDYTADEVIRSGVIFQLSSIMMRTDILLKQPACFEAKGFGDLPLYIYGAISGKFRVINAVMSVYNRGTDSSWTERVSRNKEKNIIHLMELKSLYERINEYYEFKYNDSLEYMINKTKFSIAYEQNDIKEIKKPENKKFLKIKKKEKRNRFLKKYFPWLRFIKHAFNKLKK